MRCLCKVEFVVARLHWAMRVDLSHIFFSFVFRCFSETIGESLAKDRLKQAPKSWVKKLLDLENKAKSKENMKIQEEHLVAFYTNYFPYDGMFKWLTNGDESSFKKREFSFTTENDTYMRYKSYDNAEEFKQDMLLVKPRKIDLGAIFTVPVCTLQNNS